MTLRQKILKLFYPMLMKAGKLSGAQSSDNAAHIKPYQSFYSLKAVANNGDKVNFTQFSGKKILLVNTASDCGYTGQYDELEKLYELYGSKLVVIAFPSNDFKEQERGTDEEIAEFCKVNYGITFPLMKKSIVHTLPGQNEVFQWLTNKNKNGWNDQQPTWNFSKYLVNEEGVLTHYFDPSVSPLSDEIISAIK